MRVLFDTHAILWIISGDKRLSRQAKEVFLSNVNHLFFSMVSFWEITIKTSLGKLELAKNWTKTIPEELRINAVQPITIKTEHCEQLANLPFHHRDPFDRMLIAQAQSEDLVIVSCDEYFKRYDLKVIW